MPEPVSQDWTLYEAECFLNVSRAWLLQQIEAGQIPCRIVDGHHWIKLSDLIAYKARIDADRHRALDELTQLSQELGLYD